MKYSVLAVLDNALAAAFGIALSLWVGAVMAQAAPPQAALKADLARGQQIASSVCIACHTFDGSRGAPANPILQGQHPEYLVRQLNDYKNDRRINPIMKAFASALTEDDMVHVAAFYASKPAPVGFAGNKETVALGEQIFRGGLADRMIPACAACHSPNGAGIPSQYPRLAGQHAEYTRTQLLAYREGERKNIQMNGVASKMNDREIRAVSDYIAGLR